MVDLENVKTIVHMENVSSLEFFHVENEDLKRVLRGISLDIGRSESWGIYGPSSFEIKLLLEVMSNIRPYHSGKCVLVERGMMRSKRVILNHVFYIGNSTMLYDNMNVLEFLMFATAAQRSNPIFRQEEIFESLIEFGLEHISLTPIKMLTREEKAVIILLTAGYSDSVMTVFNLPEYKFDEVLVGSIQKISDFITKRKKTFILGTKDCLLIERACSHSAYTLDGKVIYSGTVENLKENYDRVVLIIKDKNASKIMARLTHLLPNHHLYTADDKLFVSDVGKQKSDPAYIYERIAKMGIVPECIKIHPKTVKYAYEEIERNYDL